MTNEPNSSDIATQILSKYRYLQHEHFARSIATFKIHELRNDLIVYINGTHYKNTCIGLQIHTR